MIYNVYHKLIKTNTCHFIYVGTSKSMTLLKWRNLQWYHDSGLHFLNKGHWKKNEIGFNFTNRDHQQLCMLSSNRYYCVQITPQLARAKSSVTTNSPITEAQSFWETCDFFNVICLLLWRQKISYIFYGMFSLK